jgi:DNA-binding SARP family transcriptional activator
MRLFGTPIIEAQETLVRFESRKAVALLAFLTVTRKAQSRDKIGALLWPEIEQSLAALRTTLWEIRKKLGDQYLTTTHQDILLVTDGDFSADVIDYATFLQTSTQQTLDTGRRVELLQRAVSLYQDDFMAGFSLRDSAEYDDWQSAQTAHYQRLQRRALADLAGLYEQISDDYTAIQTAERLRFMDRLAQEPVEMLMRLYVKSGQRQSSQHLYEEYTAELERELGVKPELSLTALHQTLQQPASPNQPASNTSRPVTGPLAVGHITAAIFKSPEMVLNRPRRFFGRNELVVHVLDLLQAGEPVMLTGMGGIGKTSTAAVVAMEFIKATGQSVVWLETGYQRADEILLALARAFDQQQTALTKADPTAFVMQLLAAQKGLLVLDNCWSAPALFEVMRAVPNDLPVLCTSRQRIPIDGEIVAVDSLSKPDAHQLLTYHARREFAADPELDALLRMLGNHPYALAIAGKQLKAQPGLSPKDLRQRYIRSTREIAVVGGYGEANRQSIEHIISASVDTLSNDARRVLVYMGSLAAPRVSLALLTLMANTEPDTLEAAVAELEQASLIEVSAAVVDHPLYQLHDLTFNYCRDLFKHAGLDRSTLVQAVRVYMDQHSRDKMAVQQEFTNILGAVRAASHSGDVPSVIAIIRAIMTDGYFDAFGYTPELLDHLHEAIRLAQAAGDSQREALHYLLSKHANVMQMQGNYEEAFNENLEALAVAPTPQRRALLASTLAMIALRLKREEFLVYLNEAEAVARAHDVHDVLSRVLETRGHIALNEGKLDQARLHFEDSLQYAVNLDLADGYFYALYNLAYVEIELGNYDHAEQVLQQAYQVAESQSNDLWKGMYFSSIARCTHARGQRDETYQHMTKALAIYEASGNVGFADWVRDFLLTEGYMT